MSEAKPNDRSGGGLPRNWRHNLKTSGYPRRGSFAVTAALTITLLFLLYIFSWSVQHETRPPFSVNLFDGGVLARLTSATGLRNLFHQGRGFWIGLFFVLAAWGLVCLARTSFEVRLWLQKIRRDWPVYCFSALTIGLIIWSIWVNQNSQLDDWWNTRVEVNRDGFLFFRKLMEWDAFNAILATVWLALLAVALREHILRLFVHDIEIMAPVMMGVAPLIIAKNDPEWARSGTKIHLDFGYAGSSALDSLRHDRCQMAVVSDVALCAYVSEHHLQLEAISILPFSRLVGAIRVIALRSKAGDKESCKRREFIEKLKGGSLRLGYKKNTVHEHFIVKFFPGFSSLGDGRDPDNLVQTRSPMDCMVKLWSDELDAAVLWEPHYDILADCEGVDIIDLDDGSNNYVWYLCLVAKTATLYRHPRLREKMFVAMEIAANRCVGDPSMVVDACMDHLHPEFTGAKKENMETYLKKMRNVTGNEVDSFAFPGKSPEEFLERLDEIQALHSVRIGIGAIDFGNIWTL